MIRKISKILFVICSILLLPMSVALGQVLFERWTDWADRWSDLQSFVLSGIVYLVVFLIFLRRRNNFLFFSTLDHELVHILCGVVTGARIHNLSVTSIGSGAVTLDRSSYLVSLAPYLISLPLVVLSLLFLIPEAGEHEWLKILSGVFLGYHLLKTITTAHPRQADFARTTFPVGLLWVLGGLMFTTGWMVSLVLDGWGGGLNFSIDLFGKFENIFQNLYHQIVN